MAPGQYVKGRLLPPKSMQAGLLIQEQGKPGLSYSTQTVVILAREVGLSGSRDVKPLLKNGYKLRNLGRNMLYKLTVSIAKSWFVKP